MRRGLLCVAAALLGTACASLDNLTGGADGAPAPPPATAAPPPIDAPPTGAPGAPAPHGAACDPAKPFAVAPLPMAPTTDDVFAARRDPTEAWMVLSRRAPQAQPELLAGATIDDAKPDAFKSITSMATIEYPTLAPDARTLYFHVKDGDNFAIHRATRDPAFQVYVDDGTPLAIADGSTVHRFPYVVPSGAALYYTQGNAPAMSILRVALPDASGAAYALTISNVSHPVVSPDELTMYFASHASGDSDVWIATRTSATDPFGDAHVVAAVSTQGVDEEPTWISRDGCTLLFQRDLGGRRVVMQATR